MLNIINIEPKKTYIMATKYAYELEAVMDDVTVVGIIYDWRVASKFHDVLSEHTRLQQMDGGIPPIDDIVFYILESISTIDGTKKHIVIGDAYLEDVVLKG